MPIQILHPLDDGRARAAERIELRSSRHRSSIRGGHRGRAYTLQELALYDGAFGEYIDHLSEGGLLTITRWVFDALRLVSLAQEACAERGLDAAQHLAVVRFDRVDTFLLKKTPFTASDTARLTQLADELGFSILYVPAASPRDKEDPLEMRGPARAPTTYGG